MTMWSALEASYANLSPEEKKRVETEAAPFGSHVVFRGFDGNEESEYMGVARFLVDHLERFAEFKGRDLNAHMPTIDSYHRMMRVFKQVNRSDSFSESLTASQIIQILNEKMHPENRGKGAP